MREGSQGKNGLQRQTSDKVEPEMLWDDFDAHTSLSLTNLIFPKSIHDMEKKAWSPYSTFGSWACK